MRIAIVADAYPPLQSSAAVMLQDIAIEFRAQGNEPVVIIPAPYINDSVDRSIINGVEVLRVRCPPTKDINYFQRTLSELYMPFAMNRRLNESEFLSVKLDGIVWYSPSIFHGPLIRALKKSHHCKSYLILRDIFPEWAADLGIMRRGLAYRFFKAIERFQYSVADTIGVQTPANLQYFDKNRSIAPCQVEVLHNWLSVSKATKCTISLSDCSLAGRKLFVYAGNMGKAQNITPFFDVIATLNQSRDDVGFVFVGRGSEVELLSNEIIDRRLNNVLIFDEIQHSEIPSLYAQCDFGMVFLDPLHKTHNIPGKFISYMHYGLPVLACLNEGNDLFETINSENLGRAFFGVDTERVGSAVLEMVDDPNYGTKIPDDCRTFAKDMYSSTTAVKQIIASLVE
jgi:glycosyltransferase involved in cell wall biosynthesis